MIDGDTLALGSARIRLRNIDAPELDEPGGVEARDYLAALVDGRRVECLAIARDRYGRVLGTCSLDGEDVEARMLAAGMARPRGARSRAAR